MNSRTLSAEEREQLANLAELPDEAIDTDDIPEAPAENWDRRKGTTMLIVVRKVWFEELRSGAKRVEYRRYGRRFNERVFHIGRPVAFAYRYDRVSPRLHGKVTSFATVPVDDMPEMLDIYPDMLTHERIAAIGVWLDHWTREPGEVAT